MAGSGKNDNGSQFFFTLGPCTELSQKHTLFAKIPDTTIYNMIKLNELELIDERPVRPERIISTEVILNPFDDIKPRNLRAAQVKEEPKVKSATAKGVKLVCIRMSSF
jgi:peptidyl-prolyl cis-trans isomerase SDCCAG10